MVPHKWQRRTEPGGVNACKFWEGVVERRDFDWADHGEVPWVDNILDALYWREDFEISSQRVGHQGHDNRGGSESERHHG